jgi:gamma-glutamyl-gamma-aminobutyrate hydrolase PuuD
MSRIPLIAITGDVTEVVDARTGGARVQLNLNYAKAVREAGGNPIVVTPETNVEAIAAVIDGVLIPGGMDIDARHFGEENHPAVELQHPARFKMEKALYQAIHPEMPVLGICYGCQFVNVVHGGTLEQHLPDRLGHEGHSSGRFEEFEVDPDSRLFQVVGDSQIRGKSYHHQAVGRVGDGLSPVAFHEDGTIEALEDAGLRWGIYLQWHPERSLEDQQSARLFAGFVQAAKNYMEKNLATLS